MNVLENVFLFFAVMPFISPFPTNTDVQLPAFVFGALIIAKDLLKGRVRLDWVDLVFLSMAAWSFCFVLPGGAFVVRQRTGLLLAFVIYYVAKRHAPAFSYRTIYLAVVINIVATIIQWLWPDIFGLFAPLIVRTLKAVEGNRGYGGLSAEPSFLAAMAVTQALLLFYYYKLGRLSARPLAIAWALALATLLLSKSATGFSYLLLACVIYLAYHVFRGLKPAVWLGFAAFGLVAVALMVGPLASSRGGAVVVDLYQNPRNVIADGAMQERVSSLAVGVFSLPYHPFGVGAGKYPDVADEMNRIYHFRRLFPDANPAVFGGVLSSVGLYLAECGVVFIAFMAVIFMRSFGLDMFRLLFCALAFLFILVTFSITFPLTWLLLGMAARRDFLRLPAQASPRS